MSLVVMEVTNLHAQIAKHTEANPGLKALYDAGELLLDVELIHLARERKIPKDLFLILAVLTEAQRYLLFRHPGVTDKVLEDVWGRTDLDLRGNGPHDMYITDSQCEVLVESLYFGELENLYSKVTAHHIENMAREAHYMLQAWEALGSGEPETWAQCSSETKLAYASGVINYLCNNSTVTGAHDHWVKFWKDRGWTCGPVGVKQRPSLINYHGIPKHKARKPVLFIWAIEAYMAKHFPEMGTDSRGMLENEILQSKLVVVLEQLTDHFTYEKYDGKQLSLPGLEG